ncbi:848_t:CDS:2, partial [Entrophospora sp. SA101]
NVALDDMLYDEKDLQRSYDKIEAVDYHQEVEVEGIKFTSYNAGHVLGAAMFLIEIAGVKILYTGDYSREEDRHLMAAELPHTQSDVLITESTYGVQSHEPRLEKEARFTGLVHDIVQRGGRCLMPVYALGRAQELLLILDEYWEAHPELESVPIYYASSLAKKYSVKVRHIGKNQVQLEWLGTSMNDKIADSVSAVILNIESITSPPHHTHILEDHEHDAMDTDKSEGDGDKTEKMTTTKISALQIAENYFKKQFGDAISKTDSNEEIIIKVDNMIAEEITTDDEILRNRIESIVPRVAKLLRPLEFCPE